MMNGAFVHRRAAALAARVLRERRADRDRVAHAYELALGRAPAPDEARDALVFAGRAGWPALAHALLASNEFLFVE
jgi:hypothetical protein